MKRILAFILVIIFAIGVLTACDNSGKGSSADSAGKQNEQQQSESSAASTDKGSDKTQGVEKESQETIDINDFLNNGNDNGSSSGNADLSTDASKKLTLGSYPQTVITEAVLIEALNGKAGTLPTSDNPQKWTSYGYYAGGAVKNFMWYIDVEENEEKYRGVYFTEYRSGTVLDSSEVNSYQDDNGYNIKTVYWFKYDPISWTVLAKNDEAKTALIICDMIIDSQAYQNEYENNGANYNSSNGVPEKTYANNYAYSTIRKWLNETFYNTAFNEEEKMNILATTIDNSAESTGYSSSDFSCANTQDKVFLLSVKEAVNDDYGFSASFHEYDSLRKKKTTDYARSQGAYTATNSDNSGNGWWWLRSPRNDSDLNARGVYYDGYVSGNLNVDRTDRGVVPALYVKLQDN